MRLKIINKNNGFTLVEVAIVLLIGGIILTMLFNTMNVYVKNAKQTSARNKLNVIENQLQVYLEQNGRYPCPAPLNAPTDSAEYGFSISDDCPTAAANANETFQSGGGARRVRLGAVPTRTLNLPDDFANDVWGNRINYAVTEILTVADTFNRDGGAIGIVDRNNNSLIDPADSAHYVVFSSGQVAEGAYTASGATGTACIPTSLDGENCNRDSRFRNTLLVSDAGGDNNFDDLVAFRATTRFGTAIPSGATIGFNLSACPRGWAQAVPQPAYAADLLFCRKN